MRAVRRSIPRLVVIPLLNAPCELAKDVQTGTAALIVHGPETFARRRHAWHVFRCARPVMRLGSAVPRMARCAIFALGVALAASDASAVGEPVNGFPNWAERVIHEWINRARVEPQLEMNACGAPCVERNCYGALPP